MVAEKMLADKLVGQNVKGTMVAIRIDVNWIELNIYLVTTSYKQVIILSWSNWKRD